LTDLPLGVLLGTLAVLLVLSAFFSGSETGLMALNRYRLRHLEKTGHRGARRTSALLARPDRLIGLILLGNNFVNIFASAIGTVIAIQLFGEAGIAVATGALTVVILVFSEVMPKTLAALAPERVAFPASAVLGPLLRILWPLVWLVGAVANGLLRTLGFSRQALESDALSREELRTVLNEASAILPQRSRTMLLAVLDLERVTVEQVMVPRTEIQGIDLEVPVAELRERLLHCRHTRVPLYEGGIDTVVGVLHVRKALSLLDAQPLAQDALRRAAGAPYFVPSGTPLSAQLLEFQGRKERMALVVDEYGDVEGLVTLDDILEEVVGEFATALPHLGDAITRRPDGTLLVDAGVSVRDLNRALHWDLPTDGPNTLNGLILEYLETIPEPDTSLRLAGYPLEIVQCTPSAVKTVLIDPRLRVRRPRPAAAPT
jgi:Mg2+/Co2+ transporter CorB